MAEENENIAPGEPGYEPPHMGEILGDIASHGISALAAGPAIAALHAAAQAMRELGKSLYRELEQEREEILQTRNRSSAELQADYWKSVAGQRYRVRLDEHCIEAGRMAMLTGQAAQGFLAAGEEVAAQLEGKAAAISAMAKQVEDFIQTAADQVHRATEAQDIGSVIADLGGRQIQDNLNSLIEQAKASIPQGCFVP